MMYMTVKPRDNPLYSYPIKSFLALLLCTLNWNIQLSAPTQLCLMMMN